RPDELEDVDGALCLTSGGECAGDGLSVSQAERSAVLHVEPELSEALASARGVSGLEVDHRRGTLADHDVSDLDRRFGVSPRKAELIVARTKQCALRPCWAEDGVGGEGSI